MCILKHTESSGWLSIYVNVLNTTSLPSASSVTNQGVALCYYQALRLYHEGRCIGLIDPTLDLQPDEEIEVVKIIETALLCVQNLPVKRPDMSLVVEMFQAILDADISSQLGLEIERERFGTSMEYWPPLSFGSSSRASSLASLDSNWLQCP